MITPRRILLADADAFFVRVAMRVDPEGAGRAERLIVGGSAEGRGVVCSASYAARAMGVRAGMPTSRALLLCPGAMSVPVPRECGEYSRAIRAALAELSPVVEPASIDEFYCDLSGTEGLYAPETLAETATRIRQLVLERTGLPVSIGGGTNRLVAKLAVERAKPKPGTGANGVYVVPPGAEEAFMRLLHLADIPFIGPRFQERLQSLGLTTVSDALAVPLPTLVQWLGAREGEWLWERVRGLDTTPVSTDSETKSMSRENTFPLDITSDDALRAELGPLVREAVSELRDEGFRARTVTVRLRDSDFTTRQAGRTLDTAVSTERAVYRVATELLEKLRSTRRVPARLIGVTLSGLLTSDAPDTVQMTLFEDEGPTPIESPRDVRVARAMDAVRQKFGDGALVPGMAFPRKTDA